MSRENVKIALTYAALNKLDVIAGDIRNTYLQVPSSQKYFIFCRKEFGIENFVKKALIRRALYGGKAAGQDFSNPHIGVSQTRFEAQIPHTVSQVITKILSSRFSTI